MIFEYTKKIEGWVEKKKCIPKKAQSDWLDAETEEREEDER